MLAFITSAAFASPSLVGFRGGLCASHHLCLSLSSSSPWTTGLCAQLRRLLSEDFRSLDDFRAADRARHPVRKEEDEEKGTVHV